MAGTTRIGHRGACGYEPENTLASFQRAIDMGCTWIELDVHFVDNELIVIHDSRLDRTTNGKGKIYDLSLEEIQSYDAGNGEHIPTLTEVLDLVDRRIGVNVELKGRATAAPVDQILTRYCDAGWHPEHFQVSSFNTMNWPIAAQTGGAARYFTKPSLTFLRSPRVLMPIHSILKNHWLRKTSSRRHIIRI